MKEYNRTFESSFVFATIYDASFRDFAINSIRDEFLKQWDMRYIYKMTRRMYNNRYPITFLSVSEYIRDDYQLSDEKKDGVLEVLEPYVLNPDNPRLISMVEGVTKQIETEVSRVVLKEALIKQSALYEQEKYDDVIKICQSVESQVKYTKTFGSSFWDVARGGRLPEFKPGIPTGICGENHNKETLWLDDVLFFYGVGRKQIMLIQGDSALGKTTFMQNIALHQSLRGYNSDYYSLEMPADYITYRKSSILTGIPTNDIRNNKKLIDTKLSEIYERYEDKLGDIRLYDMEAGSLTPSMIRYNTANSLREGRNVDCIFVDYIDIMGSDKRFNDKRLEIGYNTQALRDVGKYFDLSIITPTKQNRQKTKTPDRRNMAEDYSKVYTSDILVILSVEEVKDLYGTENKVQLVNCYLDKNRYGDTGLHFGMLANRANGRFFDIFSRIERGKL